MSVTEAELEGLGEEERAALRDEDESEAETEEEVGEPEAEAEDEAEPEAEAAADEPEQAKPDEPFIPRYQANPVENFDQHLTALNEQKRSLRTQYNDGDIDLDEYEAQREKVETDILTLREANFKATIAQEQQVQLEQQKWMWEVGRFLDDNPYIKESRAAFRAVDALIIDLKQDPANQGKPNQWFLNEAKRQYEEAPRGASQPVASKEPPKQGKAKKALPPNLGDMPSAEIPDTGGDEWAHLDKLDGMALESALAKLSQAEQERYLRGE